jgi:phosphoribosyl 1,2-cyclic phosphodiesterase
MKVHSLYSSSSGNSCKIESETSTVLIDAGVSYKKLEKAAGKGFSPAATFITHAHADHICGAGVLGRKTDTTLYMPEAVFENKQALFKNCKVEYIKEGDDVTVGDLNVKAFSTRHDSEGSLGYVVTHTPTEKKFGYLTDAGSISKIMKTSLLGCSAYLLEADYDETLLENYEEYDVMLKERISGPWGHLSNRQILDFIDESLELSDIQWIIFGHLSSRTNTPELILKQASERFPLFKMKFGVAPTEKSLEIN